MRGTAGSPALVRAVVLCAALTAASVGAWAGEEPLPPFPGAAVEIGQQSAPGSGIAPDTGSAGEAAEAADVPAAVEDETADAPEGAAGPERAAAPVPAGMPMGKGAPQNRARETAAETPGGGSRLLRMLAETHRAQGSPDDGASGLALLSGSGASAASVFAAGGCPRALLRRLLAGAAGEADALSALGIEREILTLCRERQEILVGLFEAEAALRELRTAPSATERVGVAPSSPPRQIAPAPAAPGAPSPLRTARAAADTADEADTDGGDTGAEPPQPPRYAWFSIVGSAGALRAGVTDGSGIWFVRVGDALPGGARIVAIAGRPPGVRITGTGETLVPGSLGPESGEATPLPYRAWPGDVR